MWQTHCHMPTQMRSLAQRVVSSLTYCRSPQSQQHVWLNSKGTLSLILLCKKWHISLLMGGQKAQECTPRSKSKRLEGLGSTCPYAKSMSSNCTRDTLELTLQRKERGKLCIGPPWRDIDSAIDLCQPCNSTKPHQQREPFVIHLVPDLPWPFMTADIFDWNGLQYLYLLTLTLVGSR